MICPACAHTDFQPTNIEGGLPAERCAACGGVLVELERYRAWRKAMPEMALAAAAWEPSVTDGAVRLCPKTGRLMTRLKVDSQHPLRLDYSAAAQAIWLDAGEWDALVSLGVHGQLDEIASERWQASVQKAASRERIEQAMQARFGDDYAELARIRAWMDGQPNRSEMLAFLGAPKD
jgi:Zn-finger nucleic acid-binding protein